MMVEVALSGSTVLAILVFVLVMGGVLLICIARRLTRD